MGDFSLNKSDSAFQLLLLERFILYQLIHSGIKQIQNFNINNMHLPTIGTSFKQSPSLLMALHEYQKSKKKAESTFFYNK